MGWRGLSGDPGSKRRRACESSDEMVALVSIRRARPAQVAGPSLNGTMAASGGGAPFCQSSGAKRSA
jgi:hypothetical protein